MLGIKKSYRWCIVPLCTNTTIKTPQKLFFYVPIQVDLRNQWLKLASRDPNKLSRTTALYLCEDHFNLPDDMVNYMEYKVMGSIKKAMLKTGCLPSKFECQENRIKKGRLSDKKVNLNRTNQQMNTPSYSPPESRHSTQLPRFQSDTKPEEIEHIVVGGPEVPQIVDEELIHYSVQMDNICRTCLSAEQNMKSIYDTDCSLGETVPFFQMLMACTSIQVKEDDGLSAKICHSCINRIAQSFAFKKLCEDSDSTLRDVLRQSTLTNGEPLIKLEPSLDVALCCPQGIARNPDMLDIKMEFEEGETNFSDPIAAPEFIDCETIDIKTMENVDDLESLTIPFTHNFSTKPDIEGEQMHEQIDLKTNILPNENEKSNCPMLDDTERPIYPCEECTACFTDEADLMTHSDTHRTLTRHKCKVCSQEFTSSSRLTRHMKVHNDAPLHLCTQCGKSFKQAYTLRIHLQSHAGETRFLCDVCGKRFPHLCLLTEHVRAHANAQNFVCSVCGKGFSSPTSLHSHQRMHATSKKHTCNICGKKFNYSTNLTRHMKFHMGVREHACHCCGKRFAMRSALTIHERTHTGERPFVCDVCGKGFVARWKLGQHMAMHTRNSKKPYQCHLCPKAFLRSEHHRIHIERHSSERTHICVHCKKGFYAAATLKVHLRTHTGEKPYSCKICTKSFSHATSLSCHVKCH